MRRLQVWLVVLLSVSTALVLQLSYTIIYNIPCHTPLPCRGILILATKQPCSCGQLSLHCPCIGSPCVSSACCQA